MREREHNADAVQIPSAPWAEVLPGLFIGGSLMNASADLAQFDLVVSLSRSGNYGCPVPREVAEVHMFFGDGTTVPPDARIEPVLEIVTECLARNERVLIRCQAGLNRSGLMTALTMVALGWDPEEAVAHLREVRSPDVLFNPMFLARVLGEDFECVACETGSHRCTAPLLPGSALACGTEIVHGLQTCRRHAP